MRKIISIAFLTLGIWYLSSSGYMLAKAHLAQYLIKDAWQQSIADNKIHKPWSWADTYPIFEIKVPRINKHSYILEGANGRNMAFSAAHVLISGLPGENKTTIVSGHRDSHFQYLQNLKVGDKIIAQTKNNSFNYTVNEIKVVNSKLNKLQIRNKQELILTTCFPFDTLSSGGNLRYVIFATQS